MRISRDIKATLPKYDKSYDQRVVELAKQGATEAIMADDLGVSIEQLREWAKGKKSFKDAMAVAMTSSRAFHERRLIESYNSKDGNSTLIQSLLKANFSDVYTNSTYQPASQRKEKEVEQIDFQGAIADLIQELKDADDKMPSGEMRGSCKKS
jgi:hypothetical protein